MIKFLGSKQLLQNILVATLQRVSNPETLQQIAS